MIRYLLLLTSLFAVATSNAWQKAKKPTKSRDSVVIIHNGKSVTYDKRRAMQNSTLKYQQLKSITRERSNVLLQKYIQQNKNQKKARDAVVIVHNGKLLTNDKKRAERNNAFKYQQLKAITQKRTNALLQKHIQQNRAQARKIAQYRNLLMRPGC